MERAMSSRAWLSSMVAILLLHAVGAQGKEQATGQESYMCSSTGMLGVRFGEELPAALKERIVSGFGPSCYEIVPEHPSPHFDHYVACVSEFGGGAYEIHATRIFDDKPAIGSTSLSTAQVESNRSLGRKTLEDVFADLPEPIAARADFDVPSRILSVYVSDDVLLEVSNSLGWEVGLSCRDEARKREIYQLRGQQMRGR